MSYLVYTWTRVLPAKATWAGATIGGVSLLLYAYMEGGFLPPLSAESTDW